MHDLKAWTLLFENAASGIALCDVDGTFSRVNQALCKMLERRPSELVGRFFLEFTHPDDRERSLSATRSLLDGTLDAVRLEKRYVRAGGGVTWGSVAISLARSADGAPELFVVQIVDVTDMRAAAEQLREQKRQLAAAQRVAKLGHWWLDPATLEVQGSDELFRIFGMSRDEATLDAFVEVVHPDDREYDVAHIQRGMTHGEPWDIEHRLLLRDGTLKWVRAVGEATTEADGTVVRLLGTVQDITAQKQVDDERARAKQLEALGVLAGGIAHDFNNQLTGITANLDRAALEVHPDSPAAAALDGARQAAGRTRALANQLLTFARGGAPARKTVSLPDLLREVVVFCLRGSNTKPVFTLEPDLRPIEADPTQIAQVLQNLALNANQAMRTGGTLTVTASNVEASEHEIPGDGFVKVSFLDEGEGIPEHVLPHIFSPYFSTKEGGHGLGLAIVHSIVRRHGGRVEASAAPGGGACFEVWLPASARAPEDSEQASDGVEVGLGIGNGLRVLVVDDDADVRGAVGDLLRALGYRVHAVADGQAALDHLSAPETPRYDAIIIDLTIPGGMGGKDAIARLLEVDPDARVIVTSGYSNDPVMSDPKSSGFAAALQKPIEVAELVRAIGTIASSDSSSD